MESINDLKFQSLPIEFRLGAIQIFQTLLHNEYVKSQEALFRFDFVNNTNWFTGTSLTGLVSVASYTEPIELYNKGLDALAVSIAKAYIELMSQNLILFGEKLRLNDLTLFKKLGLFHSVELSAKVLSIATGFAVVEEDLSIPGFPDSYQISNSPSHVVDGYFNALEKKLGREISKASVVLADSSYPNNMIPGKKILHTINTNDLLSELSPMVIKHINELKSSNKQTRDLELEGLVLICSDTDSPQRYSLAMKHDVGEGYPLTPGVTLLGATSPIEEISILQLYRMAVIAQIVRGNSVGSNCMNKFYPFTFFGIITPIDIVSGMFTPSRCGELRYSGNIDLKKEFLNLYPVIKQLCSAL